MRQTGQKNCPIIPDKYLRTERNGLIDFSLQAVRQVLEVVHTSAKQGVVQLHFKLIYFLIKILNKLYPAFHLHREKRQKKGGGSPRTVQQTVSAVGPSPSGLIISHRNEGKFTEAKTATAPQHTTTAQTNVIEKYKLLWFKSQESRAFFSFSLHRNVWPIFSQCHTN